MRWCKLLLMLSLMLVNKGWCGTLRHVNSLQEFQSLLSSGLPHLALFTSSRAECGSCARIKPLWSTFAQQHQQRKQGSGSSATLVNVDCGRLPAVCASFGVTRYPRIEYFAQNKDERFVYYGKRLPSFLQQFLAKGGGVMEAVHVSQGLAHLTTQTHKLHLAHGLHFVFLQSSKCGRCKALWPFWKKLALSFQNDPKVDIAQMSCDTHREACLSYAKSVPQMLVIRDGVVQKQYSGNVDIVSLVDFIYRESGRATPFATHSIDANAVHQSAVETMERFSKYKTGVRPPLTSPSLAKPAHGKSASAHASAGFSTELIGWVSHNRDRNGKVDAQQLITKIKELADASKTRASNEASAGPAKDLAGKLQKLFKERGINAQISTIDLGDDPTAAAKELKRLADGLRDDDVRSREGVTFLDDSLEEEDELIRIDADGDISDESLDELQARLEERLSKKVERLVASGVVDPQQAPAINQFARGLRMNRAKAGVLGQEQEHLHQQRQQQQSSENGRTIPEDDITEAGDAGDEMGDASSSGDDELLISPDELKSIRSAVSDLVRRNRKAADRDADADDEDGASAAQSEALAAQISDLQTRMQQRLLKRLGKAVQKNHDGPPVGDDLSGVFGEEGQGDVSPPGMEDVYADAEPADAEDMLQSAAGMQQADSLNEAHGGVYYMEKEEAEGQRAPGDRASASARSTTTSASSPVREVDSVTLPHLVSQTPVFVLFHAPWCSHCRTFAPVWESLGRRLAHRSDVVVAKLNCHLEQAYCQQLEIQSYPEIVLFKPPGTQIHYSGLRTADSLYQYLMNHVPQDDTGSVVAEGAPSQQGGTGVVQQDLNTAQFSNVQHIASSEYEQVISQRFSLILYTSFQCYSDLCKSSQANLEEVSLEFAEKGFEFALVDCSRSGSLCNPDQVTKFHHGWFSFYSNGKLVQSVPVSSSFSTLDHLREFVDTERGRANEDAPAP